jgi:hypothetical protein
MIDYISREAVIRAADIYNWGKPCATTIKAINRIPAADVKPAVHSYWEKDPDGGCVCHKCRERPLLDGSEEPVLSDFCPSCGAEMKED